MKEKIAKNKELMAENENLRIKLEEIGVGGGVSNPDSENKLKEMESLVFDLKK